MRPVWIFHNLLLITFFGAIQLTGLRSRRGCAAPEARPALSEVDWGVPSVVRYGCRLPGLPGVAALARRLRLPALRALRRLGDRRRPVQVRRLREADLGHRRHPVRPATHAADGLVHRLLDVRRAEGRRLRAEPAAHAGDRLLRDRLGHAAPPAVGPGTPPAAT